MKKRYVNGKLDGESLFFASDGKQLLFQNYYAEGKKVGEWTFYYEDGVVREVEVYNNGVKNGHWKSFHEDGKPKLELFYADGAEYKKVEYDRFGNPVVVETGEAPVEDPKEKKKKAKAAKKEQDLKDKAAKKINKSE